jgi:membrane associated rhomboid family serine protease
MLSIFNDIRRQWESGDRVIQLIFANTAVFIFFGIVYLLVFLVYAPSTAPFGEIVDFFSASNNPAFMLWHPWTVITYQFMHASISHLFWNMLMLYWFGGILQDLIGKRVIVPVYILAGFCGFCLFFVGSLIFPNVFGMNTPLLGSSGAVVGITLAAAVIAPDYELRLLFIGDVKIKYIAAFSLLIDILSMPYGNAGGHLTHLGGALAGWQFVYQLQRGNDFAKFFNKYWNKIVGFLTNAKTPQMTANRPRQPKSVFEEPHSISENENANQKMTDAILEKIKRSGYQSLTDKEREWLHKVSKR